VFRSSVVWRLVLVYFFIQVGFYGLNLWLPHLVKTTIGGYTAYNTDTLGADLHRFVYLLGASVGEELQFPLRLPAYPDTGSTPLAQAGARYGGTQDQI
jgi:hypothetical protein